MRNSGQADTVAVSIPKENKTILGEAIKRMGGTIGKRRPYAKGIYIVIDDKATYIPVMESRMKTRYTHRLTSQIRHETISCTLKQGI